MKDYTIYVTEEIAKKAMEKGFECSYDNDDYTPHFRVGNVNKGFIYILPTAEQICGWLYEEKHIEIDVHKTYGNEFEIRFFTDNGESLFCVYNKNRKEALIEGINKALDTI